MRKLNAPSHPIRTVKIIRPVVAIPGHDNQWRVEVREQHGDLTAYDEWIRPWVRVRQAYNGFTGQYQTVQQIMGWRPVGYFRAQWRNGEWQFLKYLPNTHDDW
jgi:hypothetical protein